MQVMILVRVSPETHWLNYWLLTRVLVSWTVSDSIEIFITNYVPPSPQVPSYKLITPSIVSERMKVRGSLARKALQDLQTKGLIRQVSTDLRGVTFCSGLTKCATLYRVRQVVMGQFGLKFKYFFLGRMGCGAWQDNGTLISKSTQTRSRPPALPCKRCVIILRAQFCWNQSWIFRKGKKIFWSKKLPSNRKW